jgi:hypothetical protein
MAPRKLPLLLVVLATATCGENAQYLSPAAPQGPPPFIGPSGVVASDVAGAPSVTVTTVASSPPGPPSPLTFFKTQDSSEWVAKNFKVQKSYARILAVYSGDRPPTRVPVDRLDLEAAASSSVGGTPATLGPVEELPVTAAFKTLEEAASQARGGDLVAVLPGRYRGFKLGDVPDAGDGRFVHFKAVGRPGEVIIDAGSSADPNWMIVLEAAHHVIVQGFNLAGTNTPGSKDLHGPNAGIFIAGEFVRTNKLAHHIAVLGNFSHDHKAWGIHSVDSHTVLVQDNLFSGSGREHAAYFSDGSDDYVIRRNVFFGSNASGLQVNVDPLASLEKLAQHPALDTGPLQRSRDWALAALAKATARFGANAFPDGRGFNYIIEANVINGNGKAGGAAINLAGVRESLIQNNLVYGNYASGIAEWDNGNPFDAAAVDPGPRSAAEVTGADVLPIFGCFNNVIRHNTVMTSTRSRPALLVGNGSWGTRAYNNVLVNDELPSIELHPTSIWRFDGSHNVLDRVKYEGAAGAMKSLALSLPDGPSSAVSVTRPALFASMVRPGDEPWVLIEGNWWRLNPRRPDFRPRAGAPLLAGRADPRQLPRTDLEGRPRLRADIGAYAAAGQ